MTKKVRIASKQEIDDDSFNIQEIVSHYEPVKKLQLSDLEQDDIKVIEPKINKKKLTVDDITKRDEEREKKLKVKEKLAERSEFAVWVGNMRFITTEQSLRDFFKDCGTISRIHMPKKGNGNAGFAYVDFTSEEDKEKAIALSEQILDGRNLLIKDAKNFNKNGKKAPPVKGEKELEALPTLFVGNLSFDARKEDLVEVFSKYGKLKRVRLQTFQDTGRCKGYAWVDFVEQNDATNAFRSFQNKKFNKRKLKVTYASAEATERGGNLPDGHPLKNTGLAAKRKNREENSEQDKKVSININEQGENPRKIRFD